MSNREKAIKSYLQSHPLCEDCLKMGKYTRSTKVADKWILVPCCDEHYKVYARNGFVN